MIKINYTNLIKPTSKNNILTEKLLNSKHGRFIHSFIPKESSYHFISSNGLKTIKNLDIRYASNTPRSNIEQYRKKVAVSKQKRFFFFFFFLRDNIGLQTYYLYLTLSVIPSRGCIKRKSSRLVKWDSVTMRVCL